MGGPQVLRRRGPQLPPGPGLASSGDGDTANKAGQLWNSTGQETFLFALRIYHQVFVLNFPQIQSILFHFQRVTSFSPQILSLLVQNFQNMGVLFRHSSHPKLFFSAYA